MIRRRVCDCDSDDALAAVLFVLVKLLQGWMWGDGEEVI